MEENKDLEKMEKTNEIVKEVLDKDTLPQEYKLQPLPEPIQSAIESLERVGKTITSVLQALEPQFNKMHSFFESVGVIGQRISEMLKEFDVTKHLNNIRDIAQKAEKITIKFKSIMVEIGFPPHEFIPIHCMVYTVELYNEKGITYTKRFIERYMTLFTYNQKSIVSIYKSWEQAKWLEKRMPILNSAIDGHLNGYYALTIPVMLAQIEGVLVEGMLILGAVKPNSDIKYTNQKNFLKKFLLDEKGSFSYDEQIEQFYIKTILANFDRGKEIKSDLSRHAILHGEDVNYGKKINSLKAILVFDYISSKLDELYRDIEKSKQRMRDVTENNLIKQ
ncbi:hypothetical protein SAMN04487919_101460 [Bacillus sp. ok061]|uniref:hypothetical protein n=1 Tax=Bacillus sp. ok061 TaxID=1761766 RepID=UPI00089F2F70|nr:hypothetical protein [Bacillus sp. ok061]SEF52227.1 hypothetical protein SAMN04487919_101460 [Bacillus sp. ok061]